MTIVHVDHQIDSNEIARRVWEKDHAEVDLSTLTLEELAGRANSEHALVEASLSSALVHAMEVGRVLIVIRHRVGHGNWREWREANLGFKQAWASVYMRLAYYQDEIVASGATQIEDARKVITGLPPIISMAPPEYEGRDVEARRLAAVGHPPVEIAEMMGIALSTVHCYIDDSYRRRQREYGRRASRRRRAEAKALKEQQAREDRDRIARERGGNLGKAYDQVRKLMPTIDAAVSEGLPVEVRALLVRVEDEIFKALKT